MGNPGFRNLTFCTFWTFPCCARFSTFRGSLLIEKIVLGFIRGLMNRNMAKSSRLAAKEASLARNVDQAIRAGSTAGKSIFAARTKVYS